MTGNEHMSTFDGLGVREKEHAHTVNMQLVLHAFWCSQEFASADSGSQGHAGALYGLKRRG